MNNLQSIKSSDVPQERTLIITSKTNQIEILKSGNLYAFRLTLSTDLFHFITK